jgi:hypothetical protein
MTKPKQPPIRVDSRLTPILDQIILVAANELGVSKAEILRRGALLYSCVLRGADYTDDDLDITIRGNDDARCKRRNA